MKGTHLAAVLLVATLAARPASSQVPARKWTPFVLSIGGAISNSSVGDGGEGHLGLSRFIGAGIRLHDFIGVGVEARQWLGEPVDHKDFRLVTADLFPYYHAGLPALRVSLGIGAANIEAHSYWGHHNEVIRGTTSAVMLGLSYDIRGGIFAFSPFLNVSSARRGGLERRSCSTPNYLWGDYTEVCSDGGAPSVSMMSGGLSISIR